jgi:hypothetical protein
MRKYLNELTPSYDMFNAGQGLPFCNFIMPNGVGFDLLISCFFIYRKLTSKQPCLSTLIFVR